MFYPWQQWATITGARRRGVRPRRRLFTARTRGAARVPPRPGGSCSAQVARVGTRRLCAFPRSRALRSLYKPPLGRNTAFRVQRSTLTYTHTHTKQIQCPTISRIRLRMTVRNPSRVLINIAKWWSRCSSARDALASIAASTNSRSWWSVLSNRRARTSQNWRKLIFWNWPFVIFTSSAVNVGCHWTRQWTPTALELDLLMLPMKFPVAWLPSLE